MTLTPSKENFTSLFEEIGVFNRIKLEYKAFELWLLKAKDDHSRKRQEEFVNTPSPIFSSEEDHSQYIGQLEEAFDRLRQNNRNLNNKLRQVSNSNSLKKEVSQHNKKGEKQEHNKYERTFITNKIISFANLGSFSDILNSQNLKELSSCISESIETIKKSYGSQITKEDFLALKRKHVSLDEKRQELEQKYMYLKENLHQKIEKVERITGRKYEKRKTFKKTVEEILLISGIRADPFQPLLEQGVFESDEPIHDKQIKDIIRFNDRFEELFRNKQYFDAANVAAQSPSGMLRTYHVFKRFKDVDEISNWKDKSSSPLFLFSDALMRTGANYKALAGRLSLEIVKVAVKHNEILFLKHWIAQNHLTKSVNMASFLLKQCSCNKVCSCSLVEEALSIYRTFFCTKECILCYIKMGEFNAALEISSANGFSTQDYVDLFCKAPSVELFLAMASTFAEINLPLSKIIKALMGRGKNEECTLILRKMCETGVNNRRLIDFLMKDWIDYENWELFCEILHKNGEYELEEELRACVVTRFCLEKAAIHYLTDYFS